MLTAFTGHLQCIAVCVAAVPSVLVALYTSCTKLVTEYEKIMSSMVVVYFIVIYIIRMHSSVK